MSLFVILLGGDLVLPAPRLSARLRGARAIAADGGMRHAASLGIVPELWVGDFDSTPDHLPAELRAVPRKEFPAEKDQTDGEIAVAEALSHGATELVLAGAFGGERADHAFLHFTLALRLAEKGVAALLSSGDQEGVPLTPGAHDFDYAPGTLFSVLAFSALSGLTVSGAKWPLGNVAVPFGSSRTISNQVSGRLRIKLEEGRALLVARPEA